MNDQVSDPVGSPNSMPETPMQKFLRESATALEAGAEQRREAFANVTLAATKIPAMLAVSTQSLMDAGVIPDTRPKTVPPKTTWRPRFYWWRERQKERLAYWLFEKLTGSPVPDPDDYR